MRLFQAAAESEVSEVCAAFGITRRKVFQYLGLFCALVIIYSIYFKLITVSPDGVEAGNLMGPLVKLCLVSALPFAALAYSDKTWNSNDAGRVCLGAWLVVAVGFLSRCTEMCPSAVILAFLPFVLSALLAHSVAALFQPEKRDDMKSTLRL